MGGRTCPAYDGESFTENAMYGLNTFSDGLLEDVKFEEETTSRLLCDRRLPGTLDRSRIVTHDDEDE